MEQRFYKFIVVCLLTISSYAATAQHAMKNLFSTQPQLTVVFASGKDRVSIGRAVVVKDTILSFNRFSTLPSSSIIRKDYYLQHLGFFCRKELQFESRTSLPLRLRLGSLVYCNYLEGTQ